MFTTTSSVEHATTSSTSTSLVSYVETECSLTTSKSATTSSVRRLASSKLLVTTATTTSTSAKTTAYKTSHSLVFRTKDSSSVRKINLQVLFTLLSFLIKELIFMNWTTGKRT